MTRRWLLGASCLLAASLACGCGGATLAALAAPSTGCDEAHTVTGDVRYQGPKRLHTLYWEATCRGETYECSVTSDGGWGWPWMDTRFFSTDQPTCVRRGDQAM